MAASVQSNPTSLAPPPAVGTSLDPAHLRLDFPLLSRMMGKQPLVYLDNAATSQKPQAVLEAMDHYYRRLNANVHRGIHLLSQEATRAFEEARGRLSRFIGAPEPATCIFTRNTTEALNLVAHAWARPRLKPGDRILLTDMEHHSNIVPWQLAAEACGARLDYVSFDRQGRLELDQLDRLLGPRTRVVAFTHVSNVLGTINPVADIVARARAAGAVTVVDGAQAVPHAPVDVSALGVDFYAFSGHKMCGPTGAGMLYGRRERLEEMGPFLGGGR
jgi:cysteine desulfurase / selenocysteine lyase